MWNIVHSLEEYEGENEADEFRSAHQQYTAVSKFIVVYRTFTIIGCKL